MGGELSSLSGTKIYRDGALIETLLNTSIGNPVEWTDNNQIEQPGKYVYKVVRLTKTVMLLVRLRMLRHRGLEKILLMLLQI